MTAAVTNYGTRESVQAGLFYSPFVAEPSAAISLRVPPTAPPGTIIHDPAALRETGTWTCNFYELPEFLSTEDWVDLSKYEAVVTVIFPPWAPPQAVRNLREEILSWNRLEEGWDAEGGKRPSPETITAALGVVEEVSRNRLWKPLASMPAVYPVGDGSIRFEWIHDDKELLFSVNGTQIEALRWSPRTTFEPEGSWVIDTSGVSELVRWLFSEVATNSAQGR